MNEQPMRVTLAQTERCTASGMGGLAYPRPTVLRTLYVLLLCSLLALVLISEMIITACELAAKNFARAIKFYSSVFSSRVRRRPKNN